MLLVIDNYDSFTYNLVQHLGELGARIEVARNDRITLDAIRKMAPQRIVISPGPCTPNEAGLSLGIIKEFGHATPILGVCLGHQCIGQVYGGKVIRTAKVMHGKTSDIHHTDDPIFAGLPNPFTATRYHSLIVERSSLPPKLMITAWTEDGVVMGLKHQQHPVWGVQFHPESILTVHGKTLLGNFLTL
ncbi:MAG: aminodeoxychorismate/anthranilate synthase component II [bacterium]|nr:aminodeoxychorismate/anthranilate synthase component II [Candidatus Sumerlaeota bacterium]